MKAKRAAPASAELEAAADGGGIKDGSKADTDKYMAKVRAAREWIRLNPGLWDGIEAWALNEAEHQRKFAIQTALERIRWKDYVDNAGQPTKVSNDYGAIWARMLMAKHPEIEPYITTRPSVYDKLEVF
ncbi:hypothetical protein [Adlercreutzia sp. ZJ242]|uniref:hypothetical protein n=1 Tax=Adlercreutzia sp. ZJ242 TaxID=2709409 RepID=UPI0013EC4A07|nr:hypothetical protein [Adlercreutzia sp. ZJ242]